MPLSVLLGVLLWAQTPPYLDLTKSFEERAADLVSRMTLPEKIAQMQNGAPAIDRLGIPAYNWWSEALHGPIGSPVTVFPQAIGLSATFDLALMSQVASTISDEGRARYYVASARGRTGMHQGLTFWAPNINIFRDPRWGRGQETYGEDPFLTAQMATHYVSAMQDEKDGYLKAVSTPKHYAVHSGPDPERHGFNAIVDPRDMWNTYLPAFRAAVTKADAWSVMSAYSGVNGTPDSANTLLLQQILRDKWGFKGYVVSDCDAISDIFTGHHFVKSPAEAAALAVKAGCDLDCGNTYRFLNQAVASGLIDEATIDKSVRRLFEARLRLRMFDPPASDPYRATLTPDVIDAPAHRALALKASQESLVLLKNDGVLPLHGIQTLAVIGPNADSRNVPLGNYNGYPSKTVTVLDGIRESAPSNVRVLYDAGSSLLGVPDAERVPDSALRGGVECSYYPNVRLSGTAVLKNHADRVVFNWDENSPGAGIPRENFSARFTTTLIAPKTGDFELGTRADDGTRMWVDGKQILDDWGEHPPRVKTGKVHLEAGKAYAIRINYFQGAGGAELTLMWSLPHSEGFDSALSVARQSDAVVMVLGISGEVENEELDRATIDLPDVQQQLLDAVLGTGKPVVVVLESGSCLAVSDRRIRGLIQAWYPGEEGGDAVAQALFGKMNPSGRLPITFYRSLSQVPAFRDYKMDRRTYRYLHADQSPLYPFGYGLSYTKFAYRGLSMVRAAFGRRVGEGVSSRLSVTPVTAGQRMSASHVPDEGWMATTEVRNVGSMEGDEVVEVYASRKSAVWPEPLRKLVGFTRVHLQPGESSSVQVVIPLTAVEMADGEGKLSIVHGDYTFSIGGGMSATASSGRPVTTTVRL